MYKNNLYYLSHNFIKGFFVVLTLLITSVYANDCPKWFPMVIDDITVLTPIYNQNITAPDMDCDGIIDIHDDDIDGDGIVEDIFKIQNVSYNIDPMNGPVCNKVGIVEADDDIVVCSWLCGKYEGSNPSLVVASFIKEEELNTWTFDETLVFETDFQCHK